MKYVIWGCGTIGRRVIHMMGGTQKIVAIVESNKKLHGLMYRGIPIISFDEFLLDYSLYPVVITPRYFEDEIMAQLKRKSIMGAFPYSKEMLQIEGLLVQLPINQTLMKYKNIEKLGIYGASLLGLILYDLLLENGFEVSLVIPSNLSCSFKEYVSETLNLQMISVDDVKKKDMKLLLATGLEEKDQKKLHGVPYDRYYDLHLQEKLFYKPDLERFKNIHRGKRCFIVATGPSLKIEDLSVLYYNREICISVNGIFKAFNQTKWRPNYYIVSDPDICMWKNEILEMDVQAKFVADIIACFNGKHYDNVYSWHHIRRRKGYGLPDFSDDFARGGCDGYTVIYDGAIHLAVYMGFNEIYLLGVDCTVSPDGKALHFYSENPSHLYVDKIMLAYQAAKQYADSHGIKIYNATRGGALEVFPRVDFDSLFD